jgi:hypothetical protein
MPQIASLRVAPGRALPAARLSMRPCCRSAGFSYFRWAVHSACRPRLPLTRKGRSLTPPAERPLGCCIPPDPAAKYGTRFRSTTSISAGVSSALLGAASKAPFPLRWRVRVRSYADRPQRAFASRRCRPASATRASQYLTPRARTAPLAARGRRLRICAHGREREPPQVERVLRSARAVASGVRW